MDRALNNRCNRNLILNSKVSLIRNIKAKKFSSFLKVDEAREVAELIEDKILGLNKFKFKIFRIREESRETVGRFLEKELITEKLFNNKECGEFLYDEFNNVSIMINEENHIKMRAVSKGLNLLDDYKKIKVVDDELDEVLEIAFDEKLGYLTRDKNDLGTAMNVFITLHLPMLTYRETINELTLNLKKIDIKIREIIGTKNINGCFYEISNIKAFGVTEKDLINNLVAVANEMILKEKKARDEILNDYDFICTLEDEIFRAYGILSNARLITFQEALELISKVRLGVELNLIKFISLDKIDNLIDKIQYYNLKIMSTNNYNEKEEKLLRAKVIREELIG